MVNAQAYDKPFVRLGERTLSVREILKSMTEVGATDFYLKVGEPVLFKIDGQITRYQTDVLSEKHLSHVIACFFNQADADRFRLKREADLVHSEEDTRYRVHIGTANNGAYGVIRRISQDVWPLERIGLPERALTPLKKLRSGLILIAGATGQGKTMTAVSLMEHLNQTRAATLLTLEDPIEFIFQDKKGMFIQREVGMHVDSFAAGVQAGLREALDVIYVGEMREPATIEQVLKAAEMGHLVISTIHAEDTVSALGRIIGSFNAEHHQRIQYTLGAGLSAVITQRLLPATRGGRALCAEVVFPTTAIRSVLRAGELTKLPIYVGQPGSGVLYRDHLQELADTRRITRHIRDEELVHYQSRRSQSESER